MMMQIFSTLALVLFTARCHALVLEEAAGLIDSISSESYSSLVQSKQGSRRLEARGSISEFEVFAVKMHEACASADCHHIFNGLLRDSRAAMGMDVSLHSPAMSPLIHPDSAHYKRRLDNHYHLMSATHCQVAATKEQMKELAASATFTTATNEQRSLITEYAAVPSHMKVARNLEDVLFSPDDMHAAAPRVHNPSQSMAQTRGQVDAMGDSTALPMSPMKPYDLVGVRFVTNPMSEAELAALVQDVNDVLANLRAKELRTMDAAHTTYESSGHLVLTPREREAKAAAGEVMFDFDSSGLEPYHAKVATIAEVPVWMPGSLNAEAAAAGLSHSSLVQLVDYLVSTRTDIMWVERAFPAVLHNRWGRGVAQTGDHSNTALYGFTSYAEPTAFNKLTGAGQVVGVSDTGLDMTNCYFYDPYYDQSSYPFDTANVTAHRKVVYYNTVRGDTRDNNIQGTYHGTHVCGTAAGLAYNSTNYGDFQKYNGQAYNAKIAFMDLTSGTGGVNPPSNYDSQLLQVMYHNGMARVITNSWGTSGDNSYSTNAKNVDTFMYNFPDALVLFSAGNDGSDPGSVASPSTSKNGISVGASVNEHDSFKTAFYPGSIPSHFHKSALANFSSRGPTFDGRLKPDLLGPGLFLASALGTVNEASSSSVHCGIAQLSGTSMAAPLVAGSAVLVREYFTEGYYPVGNATAADAFVPSGALLKAMLVHSTRNATETADIKEPSRTHTLPGDVSYDKGYGIIQLDKVLNFGESTMDPLTLFVKGAATNDGSGHYVDFPSLVGALQHDYEVRTGPGATTIRVTLAYTDPPKLSGNTAVLINDLDILLENLNTTTVYHPVWEAEQGSINNVEVITVYTDGGTTVGDTVWKISVIATNLVQAPQAYALVASTDEVTNLPYSQAFPTVDQDAQNEYISGNVAVSNFSLRLLYGFGALMVVFALTIVNIKQHNQPDSWVHPYNWFVCYRVCCYCCYRRDLERAELAQFNEEDDIELQRAMDATRSPTMAQAAAAANAASPNSARAAAAAREEAELQAALRASEQDQGRMTGGRTPTPTNQRRTPSNAGRGAAAPKGRTPTSAARK